MKPSKDTIHSNSVREKIHALYNIINERGLYVNTNHDVFLGARDVVTAGTAGYKFQLLQKNGQAYASPLLFAALTSLLKHGTMLLTGAPGIGKTTGAEFAGHFFTGQSLDEILQATIQGHPQQTQEQMIARYHTGKLVKDGEEVVLPRKFLSSPVKIIDEINRLDPDKISIILRLIDTGVAVYGDHVLRATEGPLFATANYTDAGTFDIPPPAKDRFDVAVVVTSPPAWDLQRIYARGDEKLNGGLTKLLEVPEELKMTENEYAAARALINALPVDSDVRNYINFTVACLRFSEAASDEVARMTKGNAWAEQDTSNLHFNDHVHTLTKNELSVRCAKAIHRYAAALAWFAGKDAVDTESVKTVFPYVVWHRLEPSEKALTDASQQKYANDRIGFAQHLLEKIDEEWVTVQGTPQLDLHTCVMDMIATGADNGTRLTNEELRNAAMNAITQLVAWDHPYALSLAKHVESAYNERVMKQ